MNSHTVSIIACAFIALAWISPVPTSYAQSKPLADSIFDHNVELDTKRFDLHCLRKDRSKKLKFGLNGNYSNLNVFQEIWFNNKKYIIRVNKLSTTLIVDIIVNDLKVAHYLVPYEFNFDTSMDLLQFNKLKNPSLSFLTKISCRLTPRIFNYSYLSHEPLVVGIHTEINYFPLLSVHWFNKFMDINPNSPRLITRDTTVLNQGQSYNDLSYLAREVAKRTSIVVAHKHPTGYKLSPGGWILFNFGDQSSNTIILSGGFINMCMSNTMVQIAAAFLSSDKKELNIHISNLNTYAQDWGMTNALTLPIGKGAYPLWLLKEKVPEAYSQLFYGMKKYLEVMTKHKMEVVFGRNLPSTTRPIFRISVIPD